MSWVRKLQLTADDPVFAGAEWFLMKRAINAQLGGALQQQVTAQARFASLREQALLALELHRAERWTEAIAIAMQAPLHEFGDAGRAVLTAASLRRALPVLNAFAPLLNLRHRVALTFCGCDARITLHELIGLPAELGHSLRLLDLAKLSRFLADMFGCDAMAAGAEIDAQIDDGQIRIPARLANEQLPAASRTRHRSYLSAGRGQMQKLECAALCESVRRLLVQNFGEFPTLTQTAVALGFSTRTFRRRLSEHGTTFVQLLDEVRYSLAIQYLATSCMTTEAIAQRLGYSESANFRHAFRRWTGSSPRRFWAAAWTRAGCSREMEARLIEMGA